MSKLTGIIPALVTPFDSNYKVDHGALHELVNGLIDKGADGFYACGSTAECFLLTDEERKEVMETVVKAVDGRVPVIAHIGNIGTDKSADLACHAASLGVEAISSVPPFYYKYSLDAIAKYYEELANAANLPIVVYSIPALSGVEITADNIGIILDTANVAGLKYTSYNLFELDKIRRRYKDLLLFNGHDEIYSNALPIGITGAIGSTFNVMLPKFKNLTDAFNKGDLNAVSAKQAEINHIIEVMIKAGVNPSIKYILSKSGIPCGDSRKPFQPLSQEAKLMLDEIYETVIAE